MTEAPADSNLSRSTWCIVTIMLCTRVFGMLYFFTETIWSRKALP